MDGVTGIMLHQVARAIFDVRVWLHGGLALYARA